MKNRITISALLAIGILLLTIGAISSREFIQHLSDFEHAQDLNAISYLEQSGLHALITITSCFMGLGFLFAGVISLTLRKKTTRCADNQN